MKVFSHRGKVSANYEIVQEESTAEVLVIRDLGPWDRFKSVTNAAEAVVAELVKYGYLPEGRRLHYYDSQGRKDELVHAGGEFRGFAPVLPQTIVIKEQEDPAELQRQAEFFRGCLDTRRQ